MFPLEILELIMHMVDVKGRGNLRKCSKKMNSLINNPIYYLNSRLDGWKDKIMNVTSLMMLEVFIPKHYFIETPLIEFIKQTNIKYQIRFDYNISSRNSIMIRIYNGVSNRFEEFLGIYQLSQTDLVEWYDNFPERIFKISSDNISLGRFIYSFYLFLVCKWQYKDHNKVILQSISDNLLLCYKSNYFVDYINGIKKSMFINIPVNQTFHILFLKSQVDSIVTELKNEIKEYRLHFADVAKVIKLF